MRVVPLQNEFVGMMRDVPRDRLPDGMCWQMTDLIPSQLDAPAGKRGGWAYASPALSGTVANVDAVVAGTYAEFSGGAQNVCVVLEAGGGTYNAVKVTDASTASDLGSVSAIVQNPAFYRDKVIFTDSAGSTAPKKYTGSGSVAALSGSPPAGRYVCAYKDRLVLASSAANLNRLWFSDPGDPETWDTTNRWIDVSSEITGVWPLRNAILVFRRDGLIDRIRGEIPPPNTDMVKDEAMFQASINQAQNRSLAGNHEFVIFASTSGVHLCDGAGLIDLAERGGIQSYYSDVIDTIGATLTISGGIFRDFYFCTLRPSTSPSATGVTLVCDIKSFAQPRWFELSNVQAAAWWRRTSGKEELYWGSNETPRVNTVSDMFNPASGVKADADGTAVTPVVETPFYRAGGGLKRWGHSLVAYDLRDAATDNPVLTLSYVTEPEGTSYTNVTDIAGASATLPETTKFTEVRRLINKESDGIGLKLAQTNASSVTKIWGLHAEVEPLSRVALRQ